MKKNLKKALALLIASALLLGAVSMGASAEGTPTGEESASFHVALSSTEVEPGDVVTVTVFASANYNACTLRIPVVFDQAFFALHSDVDEDGRVAVSTPIDERTSCVGRSSASSTDAGLPSAYQAEADVYDVVLCQWIASAASGTIGVFNSDEPVPVFSFELRVKDDAEGSGSVFVPLAWDLFYVDAINDPTDVGTLYKATGMSFGVAAPAVAAIAAAAEPVLTAAEGYNVQIKQFGEDPAKYLIGFDADAIINDGEDFTEQFVVTNGTFEVSDTLFSNGVTVTVKDLSGDVFETYTVLFFGDTYADGTVDNFDADEIWAMFNYSREFGNADIYAGDLMVDDPDYIDQQCTDNFDVDEVWALFYALKPLNDYQLHGA